MKVFGIPAAHVKIEDPESELLTLYPDGPAVDLNIQIGMVVSRGYHERSAEGGNTRPYIAVAATPLEGLEAGVGYEVGLKKIIDGEMPASVYWWQRGEKEEVVQRLEARNFVVPVCGLGVTETDEYLKNEYLRVEMIEKPILRVVE